MSPCIHKTLVEYSLSYCVKLKNTQNNKKGKSLPSRSLQLWEERCFIYLGQRYPQMVREKRREAFFPKKVQGGLPE